MKKEIKENLNTIVIDVADDYNQAAADEKKEIFSRFIKGINAVKELEAQAVDNSIKRKKIRLEEDKFELDEEKFELEKDKYEIERRKLDIELSKLEFEKEKFTFNKDQEVSKFELDKLRFEFDKLKFENELERAKADKIFNAIIKGLEIGLPLVFYVGLSVFSLKAIYKDDMRIPSDTWSFIRGVLKK